jgi:hypothetical protein
MFRPLSWSIIRLFKEFLRVGYTLGVVVLEDGGWGGGRDLVLHRIFVYMSVIYLDE